MKHHTKIYLKAHGHKIGDFIACRGCGSPAVDIHHIKARGMGGNPSRDVINNLIALCRECHDEYGDKEQFRDFLRSKI
jgi:5-methylcytosine-specific restriction endonuclease McrA